MPNKKNIEELKTLSDSFSKAKAVYFTEFHGLNVGEITRLRSEFYKADVQFKVAKNTLVKIAAKDNNIDVDDELLKGSTALAISFDEPVTPAKVIKKFRKDSELPEVKGIFFDGNFVPGSEYNRLADLPSKEELLSKLVSMLNSPMQKLVGTINAPIQNTLGVLKNLKENKS